MTAHDPRVALTEADENLLGPFIWGGWIGVAESKRDAFSRELRATVERIAAQHVAARLAPIRAVAEQWDTGCAREVLDALDAPQDAPRGPVGGERGAEVAGGRSEGESAACGRLYLDEDGDKDYCSWPAGHQGSCW